MRVIRCSAHNFASYKDLDFNFHGQGLTLISGPTGSGKSTLCDVVPWVLFGKTAKGGTVDEIRSWGQYGLMFVDIEIEVNGDLLRIFRSRGPNDLYFNNNQRGKDITDTQKQINNILGFDYELYMSAAYFHEFSTTASFFTTTAKIRRQITEQLVDLTLAKKLQERTSEYKKEVKKEQEKLSQYIVLKKNELTHIDKSIALLSDKVGNWNKEHDNKFKRLKQQAMNFEVNKQKAIDKINSVISSNKEEISVCNTNLNNIKQNTSVNDNINQLLEKIKIFDKEKCEHCGAPKQNDIRMRLVRDLQRFENERRSMDADIISTTSLINRLVKTNENYFEQLASEKSRENTYSEQIKEETIDINPYKEQLEDSYAQHEASTRELNESEKDHEAYAIEYNDLDLLLDVTDTFRSVLIKNTVYDLEANTNKILHDYFDAEIQVNFELADSDKLEVTIQKDGNEASFTQLSKGQRQLLKMAFGVSVMDCASNHNGLDFNCIFLDEFTDGCDEVLKVKAYSLLEKLAIEHESVFVVEHNEAMKSMFPKRFNVELINGESRIEEA